MSDDTSDDTRLAVMNPHEYYFMTLFLKYLRPAASSKHHTGTFGE
jgi:hypothetical protein